MIQNISAPAINYKSSQQVLSIKVSIVFFYIALFVLLFASITEDYLIFISTLVVTVVSLWFGPISVIGSNGKRRIIDPATIFNSAMFYYAIKGIPLAWGEIPRPFTYIGSHYAVNDYLRVALYVLLGIIAWNWAYRMVLDSYWRTTLHRRNLSKKTSTMTERSIHLRFGVFTLSIIGIISFFILFWTIRRDLFVFLTEPVQRAYLADNTYGAGASLGYFWLFGVFMLPIASIIWLADLASRNLRIRIAWWLHALVCSAVLLLVSPRSNVISYVVSILIIYRLLIGKIGLLTLGFTGTSIFLYASITTLWRGAVGSMHMPTLESGLSTLIERVYLRDLIAFFGSTNLADIRVFLLVENFYGRVLPLKYGGTLTRLVTQLIPRALWPNKPYDLGTEIGRLYDPNTISGSPPGFYAEMYMNFHVIGVIIGGALLGVLLAALYRQWVLNQASVINLVLYAILAPRIFLIPSSTIANITISVVIFLFGAVFAIKILPKVLSH